MGLNKVCLSLRCMHSIYPAEVSKVARDYVHAVKNVEVGLLYKNVNITYHCFVEVFG